MSKALVVLSGGQDSTTCLYFAKKEHEEVHAITFDYGQRHSREIECARVIAKDAGVASHEVVELPQGILAGTSPLVDKNAQLEQYADWQSLPGGLEKTFVPNRNALFLVIAMNRAYCLGVTHVYTGVCQEDYGGYPDCRSVFINAMEKAMELSNERLIEIVTPLMYLSKAESVKLARQLGPDCWSALAQTHTSYDGNYPPTGKDHATLLRAKGFEEAGLPDPLVLRAWMEGLMPLPETRNYDRTRGEKY